MTTINFIRMLGSGRRERSPEYDPPALSPVLLTFIALSGCASTIVSLATLG